MLTTNELLSDIQEEIGESSAEAMNLIDHLTSAESCETLDDLRQHLLEARQTAEAIIMNINDQLSRFPETECDQLANGCTCHSCTNQLTDSGI